DRWAAIFEANGVTVSDLKTTPRQAGGGLEFSFTIPQNQWARNQSSHSNAFNVFQLVFYNSDGERVFSYDAFPFGPSDPTGSTSYSVTAGEGKFFINADECHVLQVLGAVSWTVDAAWLNSDPTADNFDPPPTNKNLYTHGFRAAFFPPPRKLTYLP